MRLFCCLILIKHGLANITAHVVRTSLDDSELCCTVQYIYTNITAVVETILRSLVRAKQVKSKAGLIHVLRQQV